MHSTFVVVSEGNHSDENMPSLEDMFKRLNLLASILPHEIIYYLTPIRNYVMKPVMLFIGDWG